MAMPPLAAGENTMHRCCYSLDFGAKGFWKRTDGSFQARLDEALRIQSGDNVDEARSDSNLGWVNPAYGGDAGGGWQPLANVQALADAPIYTALKALTGISEDDAGVLRYAPGTKGLGGKPPKNTARGRAVRKDSVIARSVVLQASPIFFFPKIATEGWTQEEIDYRDYAERGQIDEDAVRKFRDIGLAWARKEWGEKLVFASFHLDEKSPHMHIVVIPEHDGKLASTRFIEGSKKSKELIDRMAPYFAGIGLERPTEGGKSTGETYEHFRRLQERVKELEKRIAELEAQKQIEEDASTKRRRQMMLDAAMAAGVREARVAEEKRRAEAKKRAEAEVKTLEAKLQEAENRLHAVSGVDAETVLAMQKIVRAMNPLYSRLCALAPDELSEIWNDVDVNEAIDAVIQRQEASTPNFSF